VQLPTTQLDALRNLARKKAGAAVEWISIAEARELTVLGLAARTRNGWRITSAGEAMLGLERPAGRPDDNVVPFHSHPR